MKQGFGCNKYFIIFPLFPTLQLLYHCNPGSWPLPRIEKMKPLKENVLALLLSNLQDNNKHPFIPSHFHPTLLATKKEFLLLTAPTSHLLPTFSQTSYVSLFTSMTIKTPWEPLTFSTCKVIIFLILSYG